MWAMCPDHKESHKEKRFVVRMNRLHNKNLIYLIQSYKEAAEKRSQEENIQSLTAFSVIVETVKENGNKIKNGSSRQNGKIR